MQELTRRARSRMLALLRATA